LKLSSSLLESQSDRAVKSSSQFSNPEENSAFAADPERGRRSGLTVQDRMSRMIC
jgi:hypothetical protein